MEEIRVVVIYTEKLESVSLDGNPINIDSIQNKPIDEWFEASTGRDGWKGLIEEIKTYVGNANLNFEFQGAQENKALFEKYLKGYGFTKGADGLPKEMVVKSELEEAKKAEKREEWRSAFDRYKKAADYGDSQEAQEAQYKVGEIYYKVFKGDISGLEIDTERALGKAIEYFEKVANTGNINAQYYLYKALLDIPESHNEKEAITWLKKAAQNGSVEAQGELGVCYRDGKEVEKDFTKAVQWFQKAADQNNAFAQNCLGGRYLKGEGVSKDLEKAFQWFQRAADGGFIKAYLNLARCYADGRGIEKNSYEAERYLNKYIEKAIENEDDLTFIKPFAQIGNMWEKLAASEKDSKEKREVYLKKAFECYKISVVKAHDLSGIYSLAKCYHQGRGTEKNESEAIHWYKKAVASKSVSYIKAMVKLGDIYDQKRLQEDNDNVDSKKSAQQSFQWYSKAADNGNVEGTYKLGELYLSGVGTDKNYEKAVKCYQSAVEKNYLPAFLRLAGCYYDGLCIEEDREKAHRLAYKVYQEGENTDRQLAAQFLLESEIEEACREYYDYHRKSTKISVKKNILSAYGIDGAREYLSYDATIIKSGKEGFVVTNKGIYFRNMLDKYPKLLDYETLEKMKQITANKHDVAIDGNLITYISDSTEDLAELFRKIRSIARKYRLAFD